MDSSNIISNEYKKGFNLGYELAKELDLKSPMFKNKNLSNSPKNAIEDGMLQYVDEILHSKKLDFDKSANKGKKKNTGRGMTL